MKANITAPAVPEASFLPVQNKPVNAGRTYDDSGSYGYRHNALSSQPPLIQPRLAIGEPDDEYEREADRVADTIMRLPEPRLQRT